MTLQQQARQPGSLLREVLDRHWLDMEDLRHEVARRCRAGTLIVPDGDGDIPWSPVGHAISARLTWALTPDVGHVPARVAQAIGGRGANELVMAASSTRPGEVAETDAAAWAWWIGQLDRLGRHRPTDDPDAPVLANARDLDDLVAAAPERWVADVAAVAAHNSAIVDELSAGATSGAVVAAPSFSGAYIVGDADGDLLVGSTLMEIKATQRPRPQLRDWYQLLGYLLLDVDDDLGIEEVAYWSARFGVLVRFPVERVIGDVAAARADLVETHRADHGLPHDFASTLRAAGADPADFGR